MIATIYSYGQELRAVRGINQLWGFVDETGKTVVSFEYRAAQEFSEGLAAVVLFGYWGFIDKTGKRVIPCKYTKVGKFSEGLARVYDGFTYFKVIGWGHYYLSTVLDDYSRYIIYWELCKTKGAGAYYQLIAQ